MPEPVPYIEHWVMQFYGVAADRINDPVDLKNRLSQMTADLGLTEVSAHSHYFGPGVSTVIILSESHLSAHTWPESGYVHLDIVTCVKKLSDGKLEQAALTHFAPRDIRLAKLEY